MKGGIVVSDLARRIILVLFLLCLCIEIRAKSKLGNGVNVQPSYYNNGSVSFGWELMRRYRAIQTVRIEIEPDKVLQAQDWISQASLNGHAVIATFHNCSQLGSDEKEHLTNAALWWKENYDTLVGSISIGTETPTTTSSITINLMNEWGSHDQTADSYADAYNAAISIVREKYQGAIIIDIPGWGQETHTAAEASPKIQDMNVMLSAHIYPAGWNNGHPLESGDMDELASTGRGCIVGEFGTVGDGSTDVTAVVGRAKQLGFPVLGWAWNGDGGEMNMCSPAWSEDAQADSYVESDYFRDIMSLLD